LGDVAVPKTIDIPFRDCQNSAFSSGELRSKLHSNRGFNVKKSILSALLLVGVSAGAFAQEGTIAFQNITQSGGGMVYFYDGPDDPPALAGAYPANGEFSLELFYGPVGSTLGQLLNGGPGFGDVVLQNAYLPGLPGEFFESHVVTTLEPAGSGTSDPTLNVELAIGGWIGNYADYNEALFGSGLAGITGAWANPTGGGSGGIIAPAGLIDWTQANSLIIPGPEPGTLAIGGLGAGALLLFRRRK
jgi:hypothetical protein